MFEITKETMVSEILEKCPEAMPKFQELGMHCLGCALATAETLQEACDVHGVDVDEFIIELKAFIIFGV